MYTIEPLLNIKWIIFSIVAVTEAPSNTAAVIGGSVTFTCTATGNSLPTIIWSNDGDISKAATSNLVLDKNFTIQSNLTLSNLQVDNFTNYTCTAVNEHGSQNATAILGSKLQHVPSVYTSICVLIT